MAGLVNTYLQNIRAKGIPNLDSQEWRFTRYGLLESAKEQTAHPMSILTSDIKQKALESEGRLLQIPVIKKGNITIGNQRSCTIGDYQNESELVQVNWSTLTADFHMHKAQYHKNEISYLEDFNKKMQLVKHGFAKAIEDAIYAKLDADKSTVYASTLIGVGKKYGATVGDAVQVSSAQAEYFYNDLDVIMQEDDFYGPDYVVLGSTTLLSDVSHFINQGAGNDENLSYQFAGKDFRFSNSVTNTAKSTQFVMPKGTLGILSRINIDAKMGNTTSDGTTWETAFLDVLGMEVAVQHKSTCADLSGTTGLEHLEATAVEQFQFSLDFALMTPYNSDPVTKAGGIKKIEFTVA